MKHLLAFYLPFLLAASINAQNWVPMANGLLPSNRLIFSISPVGDQVVWATASENFNGEIPLSHAPYILRTSDGGAHWVAKEVEEAAGTISFKIVAVDSQTAIITTQDYNNGVGRALYKTTDGGEVWTNILTDVSAGVDLTRFNNGPNWLAHNRRSLSFSDDNGGSWQSGQMLDEYQSNEYQLLRSGTNMSSSIGDTLWNGTSAGRVIRFTNYGADHVFINTGLNTQSIMSVAFCNHLNGMLYHESPLNPSQFARTTDGGNTWENLGFPPSGGKWNLTAVPGTTGTFAAVNAISTPSEWKVAITQDHGATWTLDTFTRPTNCIAFTSPGTGWIGAGLITFPSYPAIFKYVGAPLVGLKQPDALSLNLSIAPHPISDVLTVQFESPTSASYQFSLFDAQGRLMTQKKTGRVYGMSGTIGHDEPAVRHVSSAGFEREGANKPNRFETIRVHRSSMIQSFHP